MALMASGFSGQSFVFHGYLPIDKQNRMLSIKAMEKDAINKKQTQICMETPYRNNQMLESLKNTLHSETNLCVACDITLPSEYIKTTTIQNWKKLKVDLNKRPTIFIIQK